MRVYAVGDQAAKVAAAFHRPADVPLIPAGTIIGKGGPDWSFVALNRHPQA